MVLALIRTAALTALLSTSAFVQAASVVTNAPNQAFGTNMSFALVADDFTLVNAYDITSLRFWTLQLSAADYSGSVYWAIYSDATGPDAVVQSGTASPGATPTLTPTLLPNYVEYVFDIPVTFQLAAGTYWLALQNDFLGNDEPAEILWGSTSVVGGDNSVYEDFQIVPSEGWTVDGINHAFAILGDRVLPPTPTPEPGSLALVAGGLIGLRLVRRQRQSA